MDSIAAFLVAIVITVVGVLVGYTEAYSTVVRECERLGAFYVGNKVFECKLKAQ